MDVEKLRELERRATAAPWVDKWDDDGTGPFIDAPGGLVAWAFTEPEDAELAVALRNAAPEILEKLARIEKLERVAEAARECVSAKKAYDDFMDQTRIRSDEEWRKLIYAMRESKTRLDAALADLDGGKG